MSKYLRQSKVLLQGAIRAILGFWIIVKHILREHFNKNIYTRVLFTNVIVFVLCLVALTVFSDLAVKQVTYDQVQQELLRKAKRVNFALLQQNDRAWWVPPTGQDNGQDRSLQELLRFLADLFDARITIFDKEGSIVATSAKQEVVPGKQIQEEFIDTISGGETSSTRVVDKETGEITIIAVIPMGDSKDVIENGILLEAKPSNLDLNINKIRLHLVIGGMGMLLLIIIISIYQAMYISRPISGLATAMAEISSGNYDVKIDDHLLDEVKVLTGQLNKLTEKMQRIQGESRVLEEERARFFAEISHELRTPLTAVQGFVEAIRDGMVQDEALLDKYLEIIYTQTIHISRLVDDILQLSRLESGTITIEKIPVDLVALARGVATSMEEVARGRGTAIAFEQKVEKAMILGDSDRIEQVIRNLLQNAINATENGTIKVGVELLPGEAVLTVQDTGTGISSEELPHVWDRFYRARKWHANVGKQQGSGLGLIIVKQLVQLHGGRIDVESQLGKGTTFRVYFSAQEY